MSNKPKKIKIVFWLMILTLLIFITGIFLYATRINYSYFPYVADHITVVFNSGDQSNNLNTGEYILFDSQNLEGAGKHVAIINNFDNQNKDITSAVKNSNSIYINLFNNVTPVTEFINTFDIDRPFEIKSFLSRNSSVRMIYHKDTQILDFILGGEELIINGRLVKLNDFVVFSESDVEPDSFLKVGELIIDLSIYKNDVTILLNDIDQRGINKYKLVDDNLLSDQNFGFEQGLWDATVADCSAYLDGEPNISHSLARDATQGRWSLKLSSDNHFACTLKSFEVDFDNKNLYRLSFDYKNVAGESIQYYYNIKNSDDQSQDKFGLFDASDNNWHNYSVIIVPEVPQSDQISVYFYAPSDGSKTVSNLFDNLKLTTFEFDKKINLQLDGIQRNIPLSNWLKLKQGSNSFSYPNKSINLLANGNYSFEDGLWSDQASDCSNYLFGEAEFDVSLVNDSTDGVQALRISSANHYACLFNSFSVQLDSSKIYQLTFDYKNIEGNKVQYFYSMSNDYDQFQDGFDSFDESSDDWQEKQVIINPTITNPKNFDFYAYAPSDGTGKIINLFDNIRLSEIAPNEIYSYFLYAGQNNNQKSNNLDRLADLRLSSVNRWHDTLTLMAVTDSLLLVYPRQYDESWHIYTKDGSKVPDRLHYQVDGFSNAWWLDLDAICINDNCLKNPDGSYDISLEIINDSNALLPLLKGLTVMVALVFVFGLAYAWKK